METFSALFELASVSLACRDQDTLLKTFAARVGATLGARAVFVWTNGASSKDAEGLVCRTRWNEAGERFAPQSESVSEGLLAEVYESAETRRVSSKEISADDFLKAEQERSRIWRNVAHFLRDHDILICMTTSIAAFPNAQSDVLLIDGKPMASIIDYMAPTATMSLFGLPALSIP